MSRLCRLQTWRQGAANVICYSGGTLPLPSEALIPIQVLVRFFAQYFQSPLPYLRNRTVPYNSKPHTQLYPSSLSLYFLTSVGILQVSITCSSSLTMPSKIQLDENLWFLYICLQKSDLKTVHLPFRPPILSTFPPRYIPILQLSTDTSPHRLISQP